MMRGIALPNDEFNDFLNDAELQIKPRGMDKASLGDVYVFPDLEILSHGNDGGVPAPGGRMSSSRLIDYATNGGGALILGDEDSGKTSLLKILARRLLDAGFFPLYADGKTLRIPRHEDTHEFFLVKYRSQYGSGSRGLIEGEPTDRRVLLLDNADRIMTGHRELGSFLSGLNAHFGAVMLTAANPLDYNELPPGFSVFGVPESYPVFGIAELGYTLREELISKWTMAGGAADGKEPDRRKDRLRGAVDNVLERNLVPSYPVFVLTMLQMADSDELEGPGASSYALYYEHLLTKSLKGTTGRENFPFFTAFLSELAYRMYSRRSRWVSEEDILLLIDEEARELKSSLEGPGSVIETLLKSDTLLRKESGYEFRYGYIYHYFAALFLSLNLGLEGVKDEVKRLAGRLEDEESADIMLFLTHLSEDPFLIEQIARNVEYAAAAEEPYSTEEEEQYLDGLVGELEKLVEKDRKLKEVRTGYLPSRDAPERRPIGFRTIGADIMVRRRKEARRSGSPRRSRFIDALLRISLEALGAAPSRGSRDTQAGFGESLNILWSSSLRRVKREADRVRESAEENRIPETGEELSHTVALFRLYMRIYVRSVRQLSILNGARHSRHDEMSTAPDAIVSTSAGVLRKNGKIGLEEIGCVLSQNVRRRFARELLRECVSLRDYLFGSDEYSSAVLKLLDSGGNTGLYDNE